MRRLRYRPAERIELNVAKFEELLRFARVKEKWVVPGTSGARCHGSGKVMTQFLQLCQRPVNGQFASSGGYALWHQDRLPLSANEPKAAEPLTSAAYHGSPWGQIHLH
ncbi:hypothetical protein M514_05703 [Trichuris suis]|uniref:Uncharacterized protein n=1 Tax=Trichuris suis TaxID=68888 RepID=A0A085M893_9BILA|nr:hypothetical protein M513_05703 [Trichuris suis]KFD66469.1 hypothetical protein M514_05703 [Trichuris suis]